MSVESIAGVHLVPGSLVRSWAEVGYHPDGAPIRIPFMVLTGVKPGPVLLVTCAIHGPEVAGYEVIRRLLRQEIRPTDLSGTVIALPYANPLAVRYDSYYVLEDGLNLNRVFPGSRTDSLTSRMAELIFREFVSPADFVVDFHANPEPALEFSIVKLVGEPATQDKTREMAQAFGITTLIMSSRYEKHRTGTLIEAAMVAGKPSLIVELVPWRRAERRSVQLGLVGLVNVMAHLGMVDSGRYRKQDHQWLAAGLLNRIDVTCDKGGFAEPLVDIGQPVKEGEPILRILDPFGDVVEEVTSPRDGWVVAFPWSESQCVGTGEAVAFVVFRES
ncbi:MAG TPA: succinylglutamate desuccinylase/aspartoacylase family protein [Firmicutes bacterium]|nr:succinylglutamate desuccinylase/aspartoacylase family protein [Bacillota bacterium]